MGAVSFDTLQFSKKLIAAGFTEKQAETLASEQAQLIDYRLATKDDIEGLKADIENLHNSTEASIKALQNSTESNLKALRKDTEDSIRSLRENDLVKLEQRMTIKLGSMLIAAIVLLVAIDRLFPVIPPTP